MKSKLNFRLFAHSLVSDWNHGNAHFLRGLTRELMRMGHQVRCYEELGSWSLTNLVQQEKERSIEAIDQFRQLYRELDIYFYKKDESLRAFLLEELNDVDFVIIHEWNDPDVVNTILSLKQELKFRALFHDTHHRAYTQAGQLLKFHLHLFDGVLAFGEPIRKIYADGFGLRRVWTFHEAAATDSFYPKQARKRIDVLWIGNWGDDERTRELYEFLIKPAAELAPEVRTVVHGVRYPQHAIEALAKARIEYRGYLPNLQAPDVYASSALSLHIPRRQYTNGLSGIPTIRVFEALACGATLLCAPWSDQEHLFRPNQDYLVLDNGEQMHDAIQRLLKDDKARQQVAASGLETIRKRHTCAHRAQQLTEICEEVAAV
jgi:spore maturation protein CgeB